MQDLPSFVATFTNEQIPHVLRKTTYYAPGEEPSEAAPLAYTTTRLGEQRRSKFTPSFPLLDWIGERTKRLCVVNEKAAWMFICGNNILKEGIVECSHDKGPVIVVNERKEVLGWGERSGAGVTNKLDRGEYLRRGP